MGLMDKIFGKQDKEDISTDGKKLDIQKGKDLLIEKHLKVDIMFLAPADDGDMKAMLPGMVMYSDKILNLGGDVDPKYYKKARVKLGTEGVLVKVITNRFKLPEYCVELIKKKDPKVIEMFMKERKTWKIVLLTKENLVNVSEITAEQYKAIRKRERDKGCFGYCPMN